MKAIHVSIIGASGYSGIELVNILLKHSKVTIDKLFANTSAGKRFDEVAPEFRTRCSIPLDSFSVEKVNQSDIVFIALPSGEALSLVPQLLNAGKRVIDLGGDFRLKNTELYRKYYKRDHTAHEALHQAVFGLPEWFSNEIRSATLVANPGCYPTSIILPLAPLVRERLIDPSTIVANSLSGVSGAGRTSSLEYSFCEVNDSVKAYKVGVHQHIPEIQSILERIGNTQVQVLFVPHLLPITRGIYSTITCTGTEHLTVESITAVYNAYYKNAPFIRYSATHIPELKHVVHTNFIDICFTIIPESNRLIITSAIDNLVKGAAGQAVQNMNLMFDLPETEGLL
ncbi:MAG: N-acetyl-gamma-glutamyl-phosphate reductase [Bacteroidetes bacterium]|nr:N-acetyl-gamma-glutamyl-phosphate reductase [Bacteroidota bacterium]